MRLVIATNFSFPNIGGCENVIQHISEGLSLQYGWDCRVFSCSVHKVFENNGIKYFPVAQSFSGFCDQLVGTDHLLIYSDNFKHWLSILSRPHLIPCHISICLVGMNKTLESDIFVDVLDKNRDWFNIIVHSSVYQDYKKCVEIGIVPHVIGNAVDLAEFDTPCGFLDKRDTDQKIVLCVSNFFPGKDQHRLISIFKDVKDIKVVVICSSTHIPVVDNLERVFLEQIKDSNIVVLKNLLRQEVILAFKVASLFVLPSREEVFPIVILESMGASLPWVSFDVGNISELTGGIVISRMGRCREEQDKVFRDVSLNIINNDTLRKNMGNSGRKQVEDNFTWDKIIPCYFSTIKNFGEING